MTNWKYALPISILLWLIYNPIHAQTSRKEGVFDGFGVFAGVNLQPVWEKDRYFLSDQPYNATEMITPMYGLSYYHSFSPHFSHIWQLRFTNNKMNYTQIDQQHWYVAGENVLVKQDSGDFKINYLVMSMNYSLGWTLIKKLGWSIYGGFQLNMTIDNYSTKTIDRVEYGKLVGFTYKPYNAPQYSQDLVLPTSGGDPDPVILIRTDIKWNMKKNWMIRPALEFEILPGFHNLPIKTIWALYVEVYHYI